MTCPHLDYRAADFADTERAYCTVVDEFVEPMRADICNDRFDLSHAAHCEFYREAEGLDAGEADDAEEAE
jgi:hypothetical protein